MIIIHFMIDFILLSYYVHCKNRIVQMLKDNYTVVNYHVQYPVLDAERGFENLK